MNTKERRIFIENLFQPGIVFGVRDIAWAIAGAHVDRTTLYRDLQFLIAQKKIVTSGRWKYERSIDPAIYIETPFYERQKVLYHREFLGDYIPNITFFLSSSQRTQLEQRVATLDITTENLTNQKRNIENLLIDISFSSSHLEGNTYSYLDTEVLIQYNEIAENKLVEETQMILNHKKVLEYLTHFKDTLTYDKKTFFEIHTLLGYNLLPQENLGVIRKTIVSIGRSAYTPTDNQWQLTEEFELFLTKLNAIDNPFEQSLFILVFIPYFQIFLDINKRTSRMLCNLPLLKNRLGVLSLLQIKKRDYITAILAIYELRDPWLMAQIFTDNYLLNLDRYI